MFLFVVLKFAICKLNPQKTLYFHISALFNSKIYIFVINDVVCASFQPLVSVHSPCSVPLLWHTTTREQIAF